MFQNDLRAKQKGENLAHVIVSLTGGETAYKAASDFLSSTDLGSG